MLAVSGSMVGVRLLTEHLNPVAYGELALGLTVATLVNQTLFGPLGQGIARFYAPSVEADSLGSYLGAVRSLLRAVAAVVVVGGACSLLGLVALGQQHWVSLVLASLALSLLIGFNGAFGSIQSAARQRAIVALHQGLDAWARYLAATALVLVFGASSAVAAWGFVGSMALVLTSQYRYLRPMIARVNVLADPLATRKWRIGMREFAWPMAVFGVFTWAQLSSDRWALERFVSHRDVGLYAVLLQVGYAPMSLLSGLTSQFIGPILYQRAGDATDPSRNAHVTRLSYNVVAAMLAATVVAAVGFALCHRQIFRLIAADEYRSVSSLLPWTMLAGGMFSAGQTLSLNFMSQMRTREIMRVKIVTAVLGVLLNIVGAYWQGIVGVVAAGCLFSLVYLGWMFILSRASKSRPRALAT